MSVCKRVGGQLSLVPPTGGSIGRDRAGDFRWKNLTASCKETSYRLMPPRNLALRALGLLTISVSVAIMGFLVNGSKELRTYSFTIRSSNEWKLITASTPP